MTKKRFPPVIDRYLEEAEDQLYENNGDPFDRPIGSVIGRGLWDYPASKTVLIGCPQDLGVRRNNGRPGARLAPAEIRKWLFKYPAPATLADFDLCDMGDLTIGSTLEEVHRTQKKVVRAMLEDDKRVIVLGGGNDISYPDVSALAEINPNLAALNVDSHFDVRVNDIRHSGTPYRQLLDEGRLKPQRYYVVGCKPEVNSPEYTEYLQKIGAHIVWLRDLRSDSLRKTLLRLVTNLKASALFWGLDLDVVRSSDAPGVSMTYPAGLTAEEICSVADVAGMDPRTRVLEVSEVNPQHDLDSRTSRLAAQAIVHFLQHGRPT